jgi:hypothetical protein
MSNKPAVPPIIKWFHHAQIPFCRRFSDRGDFIIVILQQVCGALPSHRCPIAHMPGVYQTGECKWCLYQFSLQTP